MPAGIERFSQTLFEARALPHTRGMQTKKATVALTHTQRLKRTIEMLSNVTVTKKKTVISQNAELSPLLLTVYITLGDSGDLKCCDITEL